METPNQIVHGITALVIAVILTSVLANVLLLVMPTGAHRLTGALGVGTFLVFWWVSYVVVIKIVRKRRAQTKSQDLNN